SDFPAGPIEVRDEFERAHGDDRVERTVFEWHCFGARRDELGAHAELREPSGHLGRRAVDVDSMERGRAARELGEKDAAAVADFEQTAQRARAEQAEQEAKARALNAAEQRTK